MREGPLGLLASCPNAPKWSIPSSCRGGLAAPGHAPGPGHYDVTLALEALRPRRFQENTFPKAVKESKDLPPRCSELGSNCTKLEKRVLGGVLRQAREVTELKSSTPGPEYCPGSSLKRQGAVYMGDFPVRKRPSSAPPGRCDESSGSKGDLAKVPSQRPGYSFGRSQREMVGERASPDTMYMPPSTLRTRAASCLNGHRPVFENEEVRPDPQTYATETAGGPAPGSTPFGAARRWRSETDLNRLGPGTYKTDTPVVVKGVVRMSSAKRFVQRDEDGSQPGPGAYHTDQASSRGGGNKTTFARAPRQDPPKEFSHLGGERRAKVMRSFFRPGTLPPGTLRQRAARLPPRCGPRKVKGEKQPGPGCFDVATSQGAKNACIFSTSPRWKDKAERDAGPGPGSYRVELDSRPKLGKLAPKPGEPGPEAGDKGDDSPEHRPGPDYKVYTLFPLE